MLLQIRQKNVSKPHHVMTCHGCSASTSPTHLVPTCLAHGNAPSNNEMTWGSWRTNLLGMPISNLNPLLVHGEDKKKDNIALAEQTQGAWEQSQSDPLLHLTTITKEGGSHASFGRGCFEFRKSCIGRKKRQRRRKKEDTPSSAMQNAVQAWLLKNMWMPNENTAMSGFIS